MYPKLPHAYTPDLGVHPCLHGISSVLATGKSSLSKHGTAAPYGCNRERAFTAHIFDIQSRTAPQTRIDTIRDTLVEAEDSLDDDPQEEYVSCKLISCARGEMLQPRRLLRQMISAFPPMLLTQAQEQRNDVRRVQARYTHALGVGQS